MIRKLPKDEHASSNWTASFINGINSSKGFSNVGDHKRCQQSDQEVEAMAEPGLREVVEDLDPWTDSTSNQVAMHACSKKMMASKHQIMVIRCQRLSRTRQEEAWEGTPTSCLIQKAEATILASLVQATHTTSQIPNWLLSISNSSQEVKCHSQIQDPNSNTQDRALAKIQIITKAIPNFKINNSSCRISNNTNKHNIKQPNSNSEMPFQMAKSHKL